MLVYGMSSHLHPLFLIIHAATLFLITHISKVGGVGLCRHGSGEHF